MVFQFFQKASFLTPLSQAKSKYTHKKKKKKKKKKKRNDSKLLNYLSKILVEFFQTFAKKTRENIKNLVFYGRIKTLAQHYMKMTSEKK